MNKYEGQKYNRLTILEVYDRDEKGIRYCLCKCDCGNEKVADLYAVIYGRTKSCGCLHTEQRKKMGLDNRKYEKKCVVCGKEEHYAKGLCKSCYMKEHRKGEC